LLNGALLGSSGTFSTLALRIRARQLQNRRSLRRQNRRFCGCCRSALTRRFSLAESTVRAIDLRYLERWAAARREPALRQMGVDEIYRGKSDKCLTAQSGHFTR
jgi:hypothetical protein